MRKRSGFFRRKLSTSQAQADSNCAESPSSSSHQLPLSPTHSTEPSTPRYPLLAGEPSPHHQHHHHYSTALDAPPVPIIPLSYNQNLATSQSNNNSPSMPPPLKSRVSSPSSTRRGPSSTGHSLDLEGPNQEASAPNTSKTNPNLYQEFPPLSASQPICRGSPAESLFSPSSSRPHSPALSSNRQFPIPSSCSSSQPRKSSWLQSTSRALFSSSERSDLPKLPSSTGAHTLSPNSAGLSPCPFSQTRNAPASHDSRSGKNRPVLTATTFLSSSSSTSLGADGGQVGSAGGSGSASQPPIPSSLNSTSSSLPHLPTVAPSPALSEEDKLRLSLERWNLDLDGVLGGGSSSMSSPTTPKASPDIDTLSSSGSISSFFSASSDPNDANSHAQQDPEVTERSVNPHIIRSPPAVNQYNLMTGLPPLPPESSASASHSLPSLVNPNRTTLQTRYPPDPFDRSHSSLTRIKALDLDSMSLIPSSDLLLASAPIISSKHNPVGDDSGLTSTSFSSPNLSNAGPSSLQGIVVSRASSMKEWRDLGPPKLLGSQFPAPSRRRSILPQISSSQPTTTRAINAESVSCTVDPMSAAPEEEDTATDDPFARLPPSIRLVSCSSHTSSSEQDPPNSVVTGTSSQKPYAVSSRSPSFNRGDLSQSFQSSGSASPAVRAHPSQASKTTHQLRGNTGLGAKPIVESDRPLSPQIPQLQRRDLDNKTTQTKKATVNEDHRTPRNHQSSPNLRSFRPSTPTDNSFISVIVSAPQLPEEGTTPGEREISMAHSQPHPFPSLASSPKPDSLSDRPDSRHSLIVPGLTLEANSLRLAELFWQEDESIIKRRKLTEWLGSPDTAENQLQVLTRRAFMNKFDFKDLRIDLAFRKLCTKMYLKGETQQVDRILVEFSRRYWEQNQSHLYVNTDMVHALSYSVLLLNTDLHVVDTTSRMSRSQFIRNTMETVYAQLSNSEPSQADRSKMSFSDLPRPSITADSAKTNYRTGGSASMVIRNRRTSFIDLGRTLPGSGPSSQSSARPSMERWRDVLRNGSQPIIKASRRSHSITSLPSDDDLPGRVSGYPSASARTSTDHIGRHPSVDGGTPSSPGLVLSDGHSSSAHFYSADNGSSAHKSDKLNKALFDKELESLLKDIYLAIKGHPIAQHPAESHSQESASYASLQRMASRRGHYGHGAADTMGPHKRASLRGFGGLAAMLSTGNDVPGASPNSPTPSASTSVSSLPSGMMGYSSNAGSSVNLTNLTTPSIGFVSNLSQSIIREQHEEESLESGQVDDDLARDSELALLGAPWAKEGILQRKQYWESKGKRHKDRGWAEVFVVIQTGVLKMFQFGQSNSSSSAGGGGAVGLPGKEAEKNSIDAGSSNAHFGVGGGNWLPNAQLLGAITLSHALTSVLVSGYSRERAHVFVLTLSNGASYFFQAGTEELVYEWVSTCNYWAARLSKEPLTGGVSNMEYGWNQLLESDLTATADKKEELAECPADREELMSIVSGHSGHSHKGRRLRDLLFNGLPLAGSHSPTLVTQSNRTSDLEHWSQSVTSIDSQTPPPSQSEPKSASAVQLDRHAGQPTAPEKLSIADWTPPVPPMALSSLPEQVQFENLKRHNAHIQVELEKHNLLRRPMVNMYWNRPMYLQKAMANWEKKSQYLMAEIIKYTTYLNALESTIALKLKISPGSGPAPSCSSSVNH
ncbi:hypothetical protein PCANC_10477 [Puccinia coronata f. sp. avenae]|uniref:SEC7 domain-containing protein n=1 Tax=Puccinia coronata f. sp. avenae TaxID=200324 RepID=A0A2N5VIA8_9BASI|nr:hypothetical protein PCANC_10477 [Puccinia coronata f. sp. avenae]